MKVTDELLAPSRITGEEANDALDRVAHPISINDQVFADELVAACNEAGIDAAIAYSHCANETDFYRDDNWNNRLNPAGIGITGEPGKTGPVFLNVRAAARFYVALLLLKIHKGDINKIGAFAEERETAPSYFDGTKNYAQDPTFPTVRTLDDLRLRFGPNNRECVWMCDQSGPIAIVSKSRALFPNLPDQSTSPVPPPPGGEPPTMADLNMTKGLIPLPDHVEDIINVAARNQSNSCRGYDMLGNRPATPKFLVLHKSQNNPGSSNSGYFHESCCPALTDWEVVAATGQMRRFVRRGDAPSGWANGVVSAPYGDALAWLNLHDWDTNTVNRDGEAIEITGWFPVPSEGVFDDTAVSDKAWANMAQWIASRAHDKGITYLTFPLIPSEDNRSYITWHQEWTIGTGKTCPGPVVMNYTPTLIERARAIMKAAQTKGAPPVEVPTVPEYANPIVPAWLTEDLKQGYPSDHTVNGVTYFGSLRTYEAIKAANRLQKPDTKAAKVGPRLAVREKFRGLYVVKVEGRSFVVTPYGTYVDAAALTPRVSVRAA